MDTTRGPLLTANAHKSSNLEGQTRGSDLERSLDAMNEEMIIPGQSGTEEVCDLAVVAMRAAITVETLGEEALLDSSFHNDLPRIETR